MTDSIQQAIEMAKSGDQAGARQLLTDAVRQDNRNARAWYLLSQLAETPSQARDCLNRVLEINPGNQQAVQRLKALDELPELGLQPAYQVAPAAAQVAIHPPAAQQINIPDEEPRNNTIATIIVVLLVLLGLYWLGIAGLQIIIGLAGLSSEPDVAAPLLFCYAPWNVLISIINLGMIANVTNRRKKAVTYITILSVLGVIGGVIQLFALSSIWELLAMPLYVALGVLIQVTKKEYDSP